jgi:two-component system, cell cycle response regulator
LWNRSGVLAHLSGEVERAARDLTPLSIAMADIDSFKSVNDRYGHNAGDAVLKETAARMRSVMRTYDGLGRYGGEEFLMILPGCDATAAADIAERARVSVAAEPARVDSFELPMTISLGIACTADVTFEAGRLIAAADEALYRAKARGRNRVER